MYPDYLIHYGVKGMKWGVRKTQRKIDKLNKYNKKVKREKQALARLETLDKLIEQDSVHKWRLPSFDEEFVVSRASVQMMEKIGERKLKSIMNRLPEGYTINDDGSGSYVLEKTSRHD